MLSRVADNLYWMSRYLERAEHTARLLDVATNLMLEHSPVLSTRRHWERLLKGLHIPQTDDEVMDEYAITNLLTFQTGPVSSIRNCIANARDNARQVREQISSEMWMQLNELHLWIQHASIEAVWREPYPFYRAVKEGSHLFQGITDATMNHDQGWQFIQLGRFMERAGATAALLKVHSEAFPFTSHYQIHVDEYLEWLSLLKSCTAFEAYCKVYTTDLRSNTIMEFLLFNAEFPRSVRFCAEQILVALDAIAQDTSTHRKNRVERIAGRLRAALSFDQVDEILTEGLNRYLENIEYQCGQIHNITYETFINYTVDAALS
ncbi:MAG: alpha-E domain-containing protein [Chloroflexi bacterium]|nr:alpha-E domain-containing protein [Chloroflexota bacterium]